MRIISKRTLREYWEDDPISEKPLDEWYRRVKKLRARNLVELREIFPHADIVGECIVFNVGGNKYRLITRIDFFRQTLYLRSVLTHREYDKGIWKSDCK